MVRSYLNKKAIERGIGNDLDIWLERHPGEYPSSELLEQFSIDRANVDRMMQEPRNQTPQIQAFYAAFRSREDRLQRIYG